MSQPRPPCGTMRGYWAHVRRGENGDRIDVACREAQQTYWQNRKPKIGPETKAKRQQRKRAERLALNRLRERHRAQFHELYRAALDEIRGNDA